MKKLLLILTLFSVLSCSKKDLEEVLPASVPSETCKGTDCNPYYVAKMGTWFRPLNTNNGIGCDWTVEIRKDTIITHRPCSINSPDTFFVKLVTRDEFFMQPYIYMYSVNNGVVAVSPVYMLVYSDEESDDPNADDIVWLPIEKTLAQYGYQSSKLDWRMTRISN